MNRTTELLTSERPGVVASFALSALAAALVWAHWPAIASMAGRWSSDPRYSHGFLVPAFAAYLLWHRRDMARGVRWGPSWWGVALLAAGEGLRYAGVRYYVGWVEHVAVLPAAAGLALLAGGRRALAWSWPAVAFLVFMIPLPYRVEYALGYPLQRVATLSSNYALQTLGLPAIAEGNVILIDEARIGVVEACNGLGMLFMFAAFSAAAVLVVRRSAVDKAVILLSAVPIALAANVARITLTGFLHAKFGGVVADAAYHDLAGWLMMPLALTALWLENVLLTSLFVEDAGPAAFATAGLVPVEGAAPRGAPRVFPYRD